MWVSRDHICQMWQQGQGSWFVAAPESGRKRPLGESLFSCRSVVSLAIFAVATCHNAQEAICVPLVLLGKHTSVPRTCS